MRVCVHRGASQIGGSCIEVERDGARLLLDLGLPLEDHGGELPPVEGLASGDPSILGLVVSHGHPDHYGLVNRAHPSIPVYIGEATARILREASFYARGLDMAPAGFLCDREPVTIGPFTMTPYLVDHSAFDAYALLIDDGEHRVLYSGDLRAHGRKARLFERFLRNPPGDVDALLLEGTTVGRSAASISEAEVEEQCVELLGVTEGMLLACYSGQNIDRLVSLYRAANRSGRLFVFDLYGAAIAAATGRPDAIPQASWDGCRVFVPLSQRIKIKRTGEFQRIDRVREDRIYVDDLANRSNELVFTFRGSMTSELGIADCLDGAAAVWSMWTGYLEEPSGVKLREWFNAHSIPLHLIHSSGHAGVKDLQRFAEAVDARQVVPVHTLAHDRYAEHFANTRLHPDGEWWSP